MKKVLIAASVFMFTTLLIAGGNKSASIPAIAEIPNGSCKQHKIYVENDTKLMWQDQDYTDAEDGAYKRGHSVGKAGTQSHARNYCRTLNYSGYSDWRLPTSAELTHMHDAKTDPFTYIRGADFWSSTPATEDRYYVVYAADAHPYKRKPSESNYIRCVRCLGDGETVLFDGAKDVK